ncbi:TPA: glycosyltransferase [Vibrio vulnificus]|nr:glycosyltransferase [Vibrio vulnificus]HAS8510766.1 glycosyltransferase [Vibrio vulnificus]
MKRILIFSHEYPPCLGGAGSIADLLYQSLSKDANNDVSILTSRRSNSLKRGNLITSFLPSKLWFLAYIPWLVVNLRKYDLIICNDPAAIYNAGLLFPRKILEKTVCFIHGEEKYLNSDVKIINLIKFSRFFSRALFLSKKTFFVSKYIQDFYVENYSILLPEEKSVVLHSGISDNFKLLSKNKLNHSVQETFLTVSRVEKLKGFDFMLKVFCELAKNKNNFNWIIAGDGSYLNEFRKRVNTSSISDKVIFLGKIPHDKVAKFYLSSKYYISLSELNESYGLSYLEAAYCGCIPIGYDRCGTKEAFKYISNGYLIKSFKNVVEVVELLNNLIECDKPKKSCCLRTEFDFISEFNKNAL